MSDQTMQDLAPHDQAALHALWTGQAADMEDWRQTWTDQGDLEQAAVARGRARAYTDCADDLRRVTGAAEPPPDGAEQPAETIPAALPELAALITARLRAHFHPDTEEIRQVLALAEEAGEFVGAFRRAAGLARRTGPWEDVEAELADVAITAYVTANVLQIDLDAAVAAKAAAIFTRGWRDTDTDSGPERDR